MVYLLRIYFLLPTGRPVGEEGLCEEAQQAEPVRQHQQQGEEEEQELHDDAPQRERPDEEQAFLQGQAGKPQQHPKSGVQYPSWRASASRPKPHLHLVMVNVQLLWYLNDKCTVGWVFE